MRRVRSQLDNMVPGGGDHYPGPHHAHVPVGLNRQTDQVQRRLDAMGIGPGAWAQPHPQDIYGHGYEPGYAPQAAYAPQPPHAMPPAYAPQPYAAPAPGPEYGNIKASLERLTNKLQSLSDARSAPHNGPSVDPDWMREQFSAIASELGALRDITGQLAQNTSQEANLDGFRQVISANYEDLAQQIERIAGTSLSPESFAQAVESSHAELTQQVEGLRAMLESQSAAQSEVPAGQIDGLSERLDEITRAVVALSAPAQTDSIERVEARVAELAKTIDTYVSSSVSQKTPEPNTNHDGLQELINGVHAAISAIDHRLTNIAPASEQVMDGLAAQLNRLSEKIDNLSAVGAPATDGGADQGPLIGRLDSLVERVEALGGAADPTAMVSLESQIGRLGSEIQSLREGTGSIDPASPGGTSAEILEKLNELSARIEHIGSVPASEAGDGTLTSLEQQLATIASRLDTVGGGADMSGLDERLSGIEQQLGASRDIAIELAAQAAEEAVRKTVQAIPEGSGGGLGTGVDPDTISGLAMDLRQLHEQSQNSAATSLQTFDAVRDSLTSIVERLARIESGMGTLADQTVSMETDAAHDQPIDPTPQVSQGKPEHLRSREGFEQWRADEGVALDSAVYAEMADERPVVGQGDPADGMLPQVDAPELSLSDLPESQAALQTDADSPLEPGSGTPDIAALVRHANNRKNGGKDGEQLPTGTDFITAARMAAQAAAAEAESVHGEVEKDARKGKLGGLAGLLRKRKKLLLATAAAVLVIALSLPLAGKFLGGNNNADLANAPMPAAPAQIESSDTGDAASNQVRLVDDAPSAVEPAAEADNAAENSSSEVASASIDNSGALAPEPSGSSETQTAPASANAAFDPAEIGVGNEALKQAALANNPTALFEIGRRYTDGVGTDRDLAAAAKWYERAAALGFAPAQYRIGNFYEKGHGIAQDPAKAATWYELAANNGNVISMHNLAVLHAEGKVTGSPDMTTAFGWFKKAAEHGVRDSQVNIGIFYAKGVDEVRQDLGEAYKWFAVAAKAGDTDAARKRDTIANAMKPEDLETARAEAELWKPVKPDEEANSVNVPDSWNAKGSTNSASYSDRKVVAQTQAMLAKLGFDPGPADGLMGRKTRNAIMAFQQRSGMPINGKISAELIDALKAVSI